MLFSNIIAFSLYCRVVEMPKTRLSAIEKHRISSPCRGINSIEFSQIASKRREMPASFVDKPNATTRKDKGTRISISSCDISKISW